MNSPSDEVTSSEVTNENAEGVFKAPTAGDYTGKLPDDIANKFIRSVEEYKRLFAEAKDFAISNPYIIELGWHEPFLGSLARRIEKIKTISIPTAGVTMTNTGLEMYWNPVFFFHDLYKQSRKFPTGVIKHEFYHILLEHITTRRATPHVLWNVATDWAINSLIARNELPDFVLIPGELYVPPNPPQDWEPSIIAKIGKSLPKGKNSEWYMHHLLNNEEVQNAMERAKQACGGSGEGENEGGKGDKAFDKALENELFGKGGGQFDSHDFWDQLKDEDRDMFKDYIRDILRGCVREAESTSSGWGSVPAEMQQYLKKLVSKEVDWRNLLNEFIGRTRSTTQTSSIKRINRRVPWDFPGRKRAYSAKPLLAIDQSGSVSDEWVALLFAEMSNLGSLTEYDIVPFDFIVQDKFKQRIKRGQTPIVKRELGGGTSFDAVVEYANKHESEYDAVIILTDGGCSKPQKCKLPLAYILAPGCELAFQENDLTVIKMSDTRKKS